jgi:hypothetical protein
MATNTTSHYPSRAVAFFIIIAMGLAIAGGILGTHIAPTQGHIGDILRKTAAALYGALYLVLFFIHLRCWADRYEMRSYRRRVRDLQDASDWL